MSTIDGMLSELLRNEGGWVHNPNDPGGETNWGITAAVARQNGFQGAMKNLTRDEALAIYRNIYFYRPGFDGVFNYSSAIAAELFDSGVNCGPTVPAVWLQRSLNALNKGGTAYPDVAADGNIGPKTLQALKAYLSDRGDEGEHVMLKALNCLQGERYIRLAEANPKLESFVFGWLSNRIDMSV